jgi:G:T-mismatch repair DNA endonuclease (very short patch repair protein)
MREYKCVKIRRKVEDTQNMLNVLSQEGWRVVCSYAYENEYLILERDKK